MTDSSYTSYPHIFALGHNAVRDILNEPVIVEEKVDGSQFSFGVFPQSTKIDCQDGRGFVEASDPSVLVLRARSKGCQITIEAPQKLFQSAVDAVKARQHLLHPGWTYRGEVVAKPKHNTLCYNRTPKDNVIIFDINTGQEAYLSYEEKKAEAERIGFEVVPLVFSGKLENIEQFRALIDRESVLGGQAVEGVVVKNYARFGIDGKVLMGKFVSEAFKEVHQKDWKESNPKSGDILARLVSMYRTPARWAKAVQHLREEGKLEDSPRDIGKLIPATGDDIKAECEAEIKELLFKWAWPHVQRGVIGGIAEWYKDELLKKQFEKETV